MGRTRHGRVVGGGPPVASLRRCRRHGRRLCGVVLLPARHPLSPSEPALFVCPRACRKKLGELPLLHAVSHLQAPPLGPQPGLPFAAAPPDPASLALHDVRGYPSTLELHARLPAPPDAGRCGPAAVRGCPSGCAGPPSGGAQPWGGASPAGRPPGLAAWPSCGRTCATPTACHARHAPHRGTLATLQPGRCSAPPAQWLSQRPARRGAFARPGRRPAAACAPDTPTLNP